MSLASSIGGAPYSKHSLKVIRLLRKGCANRPFFHISVMESFRSTEDPVIEQIGSYDPLPNQFNEKLVAINFDRLKYWLRDGAITSSPVNQLLGLCGYFPIYPVTFEDAWCNRKKISATLEELRNKVASLSEKQPEKPTKAPDSSAENSTSTELSS